MMKTLRFLLSARESLKNINTDGILVDIDEETRNRLREVFLEMLSDVQNVCLKHHLQLFLSYGTALGAIRHHGFIPWDDDIDIAMSRADYNRFVALFDQELGEKYEINAPKISEKPMYRFTKIFKRGTVYREDMDYSPEGHGIFLDLFVSENIPRNPVIRRIRGTCCNACQFIASQVFLYENRNPALKALFSQNGKANYQIRLVLGFLFSLVSSGNWFNLVDRFAQYRYTGLYGFVTGRKHYFGEIFEENVLFPKREAEFCGQQAFVFNQVEIYLENLYGDYMKIPPENERERHYIVELNF